MKINRIIFIIQDRFTKRNMERFGIQRLMNRGFNVEVWECSPFLMPVLFEEFTPPDSLTFVGFKLFHSEKLLLGSIDGLTFNDVVLTCLGNTQIKTRRIYKRISEKNIHWGACLSGRMPISVEMQGFSSRATRLCENPKLVFEFLFRKLPVNLFGLRPFQFLLVSGAAPTLHCFPGLIDSRTEILNAHGIEYDLYLKNREQDILSKSDKVVFLDTCGPFHPDRAIFKTQFPCSEKEYYSNLNFFFNMIETKFGCRVVIAAHPKSKYEEMPEFFEGRQVLRGETHNLVKDSKFVITAGSTAVYFAVMYKKPIIFLALNPDCANEFDLKINPIASALGKSPLCWSKNSSVDLEAELGIDEEKYSQFMESYIKKTGSPKRYSWDIFADYLESL
jgi:hypothetical protein